MRGSQVTILWGRVGANPELRTLPSGKHVCEFSVATNERWKGKDGQAQEHTEWHRVVVYDLVAEFVGAHCKSGSGVYVMGKLRTKKWEKDGVTRYTTRIAAEVVQLTDRVGDSGGIVPDTEAADYAAELEDEA